MTNKFFDRDVFPYKQLEKYQMCFEQKLSAFLKMHLCDKTTLYGSCVLSYFTLKLRDVYILQERARFDVTIGLKE